MEATRRFWATAAVGGMFVVLAVLTDRPFALAGAIGIGAWLIATVLVAGRSFRHVDRELSLDYDVSPGTVHVDSNVFASLTATRPTTAVSTTLELSVSPPPGIRIVDEMEPTVTLQVGETEASMSVPLQVGVAGQYTMPRATVSMTDQFGLYRETVRRGPEPTVHVTPRTPTVHVGKGGRPFGIAFGDHETDKPGPGVAVRGLRQYVPGETAAAIDWKSTARLGEPYVQETEGDTDRHTVLLVDHRHRTDKDTDGETPLDYGREVALGMTASAVERSDPLSLWTVGDEGITDVIPAGSDPTTYNRVRSTLLGLTATSTNVPESPVRDRLGELADDILTESTPFDRTLRQYSAESDSYVHRLRDDSFVGAIRRARAQLGAEAWLVVVTTDHDPARLTESVKLAARGGTQVLVFLMPTALFRERGLGDVETTYREYAEFESLRRSLDRHPRVTALEVAPGDRLDALLAAQKDGRAEREAQR